MASIRKRGEYQWFVEIRRKNYPVVRKTFNTKADAERWARETESEMDRGVWVCRKEAEGTSFEEALTRYSNEITPTKRSEKQEISIINRWKAHKLASRSLASLRSTDFAGYRDERLKAGKAPATVKLELALARHLFTVARKEWGIEVGNPVRDIRMPKVTNQRDRRFQGDEETRLMAVLAESGNPYAAGAVKFAIETALRRSKLVSLKWSQVKRGDGYDYLELPVEDVAQKKHPIHLPLSQEALKVLGSLPRSIDGRIFPIHEDDLSRAFIAAARKAEIENMRFHDLRHEATSRLVEQGYTDFEVMAITGHKTLVMLQRYAHLRPNELGKKMASRTP